MSSFNYPSVISTIKYSTPSLLLSYISKPCLNKGWVFFKNLSPKMEVSTDSVLYIWKITIFFYFFLPIRVTMFISQRFIITKVLNLRVKCAGPTTKFAKLQYWKYWWWKIRKASGWLHTISFTKLHQWYTHTTCTLSHTIQQALTPHM